MAYNHACPLGRIDSAVEVWVGNGDAGQPLEGGSKPCERGYHLSADKLQRPPAAQPGEIPPAGRPRGFERFRNRRLARQGSGEPAGRGHGASDLPLRNSQEGQLNSLRQLLRAICKLKPNEWVYYSPKPGTDSSPPKAQTADAWHLRELGEAWMRVALAAAPAGAQSRRRGELR